MNQRRQSLADLCRQFQISILYLFGSRAIEIERWLDGDAAVLPSGPSDVDVGVKPRPGIKLSLREKVEMALALEDLLGVSRVDLITLPEADPFLAANIIRGQRLVAHDEDAADEYDLYVLRRAGDLIPLERERMALILGKADESGTDL